MEANGLSKCQMPSICLGCGSLDDTDTVMVDEIMTIAFPTSPIPVGGSATVTDTTACAATTTTDMDDSITITTNNPLILTTATITPSSGKETSNSNINSNSHQHVHGDNANNNSTAASASSSSFIRCPNCRVARYCSDQCLRRSCCSSSSSSSTCCNTDDAPSAKAVLNLKGVCDAVARSQRIVEDIQDRIANCYSKAATGTNQQQQQQQQQQQRTNNNSNSNNSNNNSPQQQQQQQQQQKQEESLESLQDRLFTEKVHLIDALVIMALARYQSLLLEGAEESSSSSFEKAEAAVRYIYEEALDHSIQIFCSSPSPSPSPSPSTPSASSSDSDSNFNSNNNININIERLMILLLILDFDEYCETLLDYQLTREQFISSMHSTTTTTTTTTNDTNGADVAFGIGSDSDSDMKVDRQRQRQQRMGTIVTTNINTNIIFDPDAVTTRGENYLQLMHDLWKSGRFERSRFDPSITNNEEQDVEHFAKIHAAGLCLVLFRKLESQRVVDHVDLDHHHHRHRHRHRQLQVLRTQTDLNLNMNMNMNMNTTMERQQRQFRYLFDDYLPRQLTQPSMNNIIATKYAHVLFQDGTPTVYWSLLADSYRKEWGECIDRDYYGTTSSTSTRSGEESSGSSDMDTGDDDDDDDDDDKDDGK